LEIIVGLYYIKKREESEINESGFVHVGGTNPPSATSTATTTTATSNSLVEKERVFIITDKAIYRIQYHFAQKRVMK
jgi:hypothetical protein